MAKRQASDTKPARAPSPASQRKSAAVEAYTKQTGHAPPKNWTTAKIEGRTRTLGVTQVAGTGYTGNKAGAARSPISVDPAKLGQARLDTAKAQAAIAHSTGSKKWAAAGLHNAAEADKRWGQVASRLPADSPKTASAPVPMPTSEPRSMASRVVGALSKASVPLATVGAGVAAMRAYREVKEKGGTHENAVLSGVAAAAVPAAIAASPVVAKVGQGLRHGGFATARAGMEMLGSVGGQIDNALGLGVGVKMIVGGGAVGGLGAGLEVVGKLTSKAVLPAAAAFGAYQGMSEDSNKIRGAARGGLRSLDPTAIMMKRGVVERGFDAAFGKPSTPSTNRLTSGQEQKFASANMDYHQKSTDHGAPQPHEGGKGWVNGRGFANPDVQEAAQEGRRKKMGVP